MYTGITNPEILQIIQGVDQSVKTSRTIQSQSDLCGGAVLTITNAWTTAANLSFTTDQIAVAYESELIYVAKMFCITRQDEVGG
jgi:hypothetical protein